MFFGVCGTAIFCYVARSGGDAARTTSLLKLKVIACMKAVNWFLAMPLYLTLLFCLEKTCSNGARSFV